MQHPLERRGARVAGAALVLAATAFVWGLAGAPAAETTSAGGVTRKALAEAAPANAPGQRLYLQEVRIAPGAELPTHYHEGTQIASIRSGVLTYDIVSGTAEVTRADGSVVERTGPVTIRLRRGDSLIETHDLVHFGSNKGRKPVVVLLAALLAEDAPLATTVQD